MTAFNSLDMLATVLSSVWASGRAVSRAAGAASGAVARLAAVLVLVALFSTVDAAQQKRTSYGPVVNAYLTGLGEELNELEYQLRNQEIGRADYERAKQRLTILRRYVERRASESNEDIVPEFQALAEDELNTLGLGRDYQADELIAGMELDGQWKIIGVQMGIARKPTRFLVLERLPRTEMSGVGERRLGKTVDPRDVIETIIVHETPPQPPAAPQQAASPAPVDQALITPARGETPTAAEAPSLQSPRILHIYLPEYTAKAREKKIEGEVVVRALFQRDGKIKNTKVEKGIGFGLDERAVEAVKRLGFAPAQFEGKLVDAQAQIVFDFNLQKVAVYIIGAELSGAPRGGKF
jgi:TonB family protein